MVDDKAEHLQRPPCSRRGLLEVRQNSEPPGSRRTPADERQQTTLSPPFNTPLLALSHKGIHYIHSNAAVAQGLPPLSSPATTCTRAAHLCRVESGVRFVPVLGAQRTGSLSYQITGDYHSKYCSSVRSSLWATK